VEGILSELISGIQKAIQTVSAMLPSGFPDLVANTILEGIQAAAVEIVEHVRDFRTSVFE
jgi:hypothetical protein